MNITGTQSLSQNSYQHPPLPPELRQALWVIKSYLEEVYPDTLDAWEEDFRRDQHPDQEILLWRHLSTTYHQLVAGRPFTFEQKMECFKVLLACTMTGREEVLDTITLTAISPAEAAAVVDAYYTQDV